MVSRTTPFRVAAALAAAVLAPLAARAAAPPTAAEAAELVKDAEARLLDLWSKQQRAAWVQSTFITDDTEAIAALANEALLAATTELAAQATRFDGLTLPPDVARKLALIKLTIITPAPNDPKLRKELTEITTSLESDYGKGKYCPPPGGGACLDLDQLSETMAKSRDPNELLRAWTGWRTVSPPMRDRYRRFVELGNQGARELGFSDVGALWRSGYDMPPDAFAKEVDRLWSQVEPLYESLHCYMRGRLQEVYGKRLVPDGKPIPAHLLGNMWAQQWGNVYPLVAPPKTGESIDVTGLLAEKKVDEVEMVRYGERFFRSLGLDALPPSFWERSLFKRPQDREVVCHASAWDVDFDEDVRLKMCIKIDGEDFATVHHELGHNYYQLAYRHQPPLYRDSANDGFHEAIGDTLALSITPEYLARVGLLAKVPEDASDLDLLMQMALEKIAFLPFGLLVDQWRWKVFSGEIQPGQYNAAWWALRERYQGVAPPVARSEADFDPGAKYHVAANVPYTRYFLAHILQFQFQRALCRQISYQGPLHRCSIYGNEEAGKRLWTMLEMGRSRLWPEALEALTGEKQMDATAIADYFAPLKAWLDEQNKGRACGWR